LIDPLIPPAKQGDKKRTISERDVVDGVMCILSKGCQWAALPKDLPPRTTANDYPRRWDDDRTLDRIHHALYVKCRELETRDQPDRGDCGHRRDRLRVAVVSQSWWKLV
jgi:transposase